MQLLRAVVFLMDVFPEYGPVPHACDSAAADCGGAVASLPEVKSGHILCLLICVTFPHHFVITLFKYRHNIAFCT